jgi:hypothetical protein
MRWDGDMARMDSREMHTVFWLGNPNQRDNFDDLGVDKILLKGMFKI